jgi:hypothetical protein
VQLASSPLSNATNFSGATTTASDVARWVRALLAAPLVLFY